MTHLKYLSIVLKTHVYPASNNMFLLLCASVGDFQQPFDINVELKGVMQDASVMQINQGHKRSRMLHCGAVSVNQPSFLSGCMLSFSFRQAAV